MKFNTKDWKTYKKKPVEIKAFQTDKEILIDTLEGTMKANIGDWIIQGIFEEFYPCKPDIFEKTYEEINVCEKCGNNKAILHSYTKHLMICNPVKLGFDLGDIIKKS